MIFNNINNLINNNKLFLYYLPKDIINIIIYDYIYDIFICNYDLSTVKQNIDIIIKIKIIINFIVENIPVPIYKINSIKNIETNWSDNNIMALKIYSLFHSPYILGKVNKTYNINLFNTLNYDYNSKLYQNFEIKINSIYNYIFNIYSWLYCKNWKFLDNIKNDNFYNQCQTCIRPGKKDPKYRWIPMHLKSKCPISDPYIKCTNCFSITHTKSFCDSKNKYKK
jgi:hypothetical protein